MSSGEMIVLALLGGGLVCSLTLFFWLIRLMRRDGKKTPK